MRSEPWDAWFSTSSRIFSRGHPGLKPILTTRTGRPILVVDDVSGTLPGSEAILAFHSSMPSPPVNVPHTSRRNLNELPPVHEPPPKRIVYATRGSFSSAAFQGYHHAGWVPGPISETALIV